MQAPDAILAKRSDLIQQGRFAELETETVEIKSVPATGADWKEVHISVNAFLSTRGGSLILGVREEGTGQDRRDALDGWKDHAEPNLKEFSRLLTDRKGVRQDLGDCFPPMEILPLLGGRVAVVYVDELAADRWFVFLNGTAYRRLLTGDHKLTDREVEAQEEFKEEFKEEAIHAKELQPVPDMSEADFDLTKLNEFIFHLNQPKAVETLKPDIGAARPFLERRCFLKDGAVTVLSIKPGVHVSIRNPGAFRRTLIIEDGDAEIPVRRILPEAKPRHPKLADVLRVSRKWEGKGYGMSTLVNLCLENRIDLPYYRIYTEEVCLFLNAATSDSSTPSIVRSAISSTNWRKAPTCGRSKAREAIPSDMSFLPAPVSCFSSFPEWHR